VDSFNQEIVDQIMKTFTPFMTVNMSVGGTF